MAMRDEPAATFDVRIWLLDEQTVPADLASFMAEVREIAEAHPNVEVRWTCERVDRLGRPRFHRTQRTST